MDHLRPYRTQVKRCNADGSVGHPHVRVGHRQVSKYINRIKQSRIKDKNPSRKAGVFLSLNFKKLVKQYFVFTDYSIAILGRDGDTSCPYHAVPYLLR